MSYRPITDVWILARPKVKYYGAYPNGFLERARALLGVTPFDPVLHVCGGAARQYPAKPRGFGPRDRTLDLDASLEPDYCQAATKPLPLFNCGMGDCLDCEDGAFETGIKGHRWPALIADPPYTETDAEHYAPGRAAFPSANKILRNMLDIVRVGGRVGMLHYVLPQPPREGVRRGIRRPYAAAAMAGTMRVRAMRGSQSRCVSAIRGRRRSARNGTASATSPGRVKTGPICTM